MLKFEVDSLFLADLHDDFVMNETQKLYEFIDGDPVTAFHLGWRISGWFSQLDKKQQYLYSKAVRHNEEEVQPYREQIKYWSNKYPTKEDQEVDLIAMTSYVFDNMLWFEDTKELDQVKVAFFLGMVIGTRIKPDEPEENKETEDFEVK